MNPQKPKYAHYLHDGLYYKKGVHDFIFFYDEPTSQWVRSSKQWFEVQQGVRV